MQNTTADYKLEINKPSRSFECKITIGENIYNNEDLVSLILEHSQPKEGFSIGNTVSQSLDLTLLNRGDIIFSTSQIKVEIGLKIGGKIEYIPMGIFNIDDIEKTDYTTKFTAYDNMIKFESTYFSSLGDKPTLQQVVNELSEKTSVKFTGSLPAYTVSKLDGFSCREVLSYVASICGGNAFITRDGKFTIKSLVEVEKAIDGNNYFDYKREEVKYKIGQVSCQVGENNILSKGSLGTDSMELQFENPWVTATILTEIYNKLKGLSYLGYSMKWQGDLSLDPYDIITVTDVKNVVRKIPILSQKISYTGGLTSEIGGKGETKNKNSFSSSGSISNKVNRTVIEQAIIKDALIEKANIKDVEAVSIRTQNLEAKTAKIEEAIIGVVHVTDLNAINANIENLIAADATINNALIGKADITELNAIQGNINSINSQVANIQTLVNGNLSSENIQAGGITSDKLTIANGFITNAMIASLDVSKINAGNISTNKFRIVSDDGGIEIVGATQQFKDKNNKVRIQMGQDTQGNFNFILRGEDGTTTLIDHTGIKENAIADNLIKENMVAADAIGEKQINYSSLITGLNKDTNTQLIKASKVAIDLTGQSLEVAFNSLKSNVDSKETRNLFIKKNSVDGIYNDANFVESTNYKTSDYIAVTEGEIYTLCKFSTDGYHRIIAFDEDKNRLGNRLVKQDNILKYIVPINVKYIRISIEKEIIKYKIERYENPNPVWTSAPEDIDSLIESNSTTINVMQGQIATAINNTQITKNGQTILLKDDYNRTVSKVDSINSTIGTHTTKLDQLTSNITNVDTKVNNVQRDLNGTKSTVSSHTSQISSLNSTVNTQSSSINQLKNQIALKVEATDVIEAINNVKIGGRNYIIFSKVSSYTSYNTITSKEIGYIKSTWKSTYENNIFTLKVSGFELEKTIYTISGIIKVNGKIPANKYFTGYASTKGSGLLKNEYDSETGKFVITQTYSNSSDWIFHAPTTRASGSSDIVELFNLKFEEGNKETDFTVAQEDIDNSISNVQKQITTTSNKVATIETNLNSITNRVSSTERNVTTINGNITNITNRVTTAESKLTATSLTTTISSAISGGSASISTTQFVMDKNGFTVKNGAIKIQNKAGTIVLNSDTNGNLIISGTMKSQSGDMYVALDAGGVTFQDWHRKEQMLRIGTSYFGSNRDMNGVTFAMPQYGDFVRFAHIAKPDLTNGWSSSDTQNIFMDIWSGTHTFGGKTYEKGIHAYAPLYIYEDIKFKHTGNANYPNRIASASWNNIDGLLGIYGDNGAILGYQNGSSIAARIVVSEGSHPGTGDNIKSWGNWNCSGSTVHNATFSGNHVNSYSNSLTRTFTETHCIEAESKQIRINFKDVKIVNGKAIINIPNAYIGINLGYIVSSIVKKGEGDVWVLEEQENRFIIAGNADIKVNVEVIINLDSSTSYSLKRINDDCLCIDVSSEKILN